ncbi:hypothetical protein EVAR_66647_1 [Eumeta japonica]|uniref:Uncharacterized protein n=1 Tax=Eumeta variegata TaxID=151549 RepID=A0A4C1ZQY2_EUMVA|nr:hypothetical protein EVAR_66647_1 [Eumeta japonica]
MLKKEEEPREKERRGQKKKRSQKYISMDRLASLRHVNFPDFFASARTRLFSVVTGTGTSRASIHDAEITTASLSQLNETLHVTAPTKLI